MLQVYDKEITLKFTEPEFNNLEAILERANRAAFQEKLAAIDKHQKIGILYNKILDEKEKQNINSSSSNNRTEAYTVSTKLLNHDNDTGIEGLD